MHKVPVYLIFFAVFVLCIVSCYGCFYYHFIKADKEATAIMSTVAILSGFGSGVIALRIWEEGSEK